MTLNDAESQPGDTSPVLVNIVDVSSIVPKTPIQAAASITCDSPSVPAYRALTVSTPTRIEDAVPFPSDYLSSTASSSRPTTTISPAFAESICWPGESPVKKAGTARKRIKFPSAVGAGLWQDYWKDKSNEKTMKEERKQEKARKKEEKAQMAALKRKSIRKKKKEVFSSDEEEDEEMSSGHTSDDVDWSGLHSPTPVSSDVDTDNDTARYENGDFVLVAFPWQKELGISLGAYRKN